MEDERHLKHLLRFLSGTKDEFLYLTVPDVDAKDLWTRLHTVDTFTDSNWAEDPDNSASTTSSFTFIGDILVEQTVTNQETIAQSTCEAE